VRRLVLVAGLALAAACGGSSGAGTVSPASAPDTPDATVTRFLRAVADSNIAAMAQLWGTVNGPASETRQPPQWERRLEVMQYYLRHEAARITSSAGVTNQADRHAIVAELAREGCTVTVPFQLVRLPGGGWLVNEIDLDAIGNPARRCDERRRTSR
jgi:hypothetical protein